MNYIYPFEEFEELEELSSISYSLSSSIKDYEDYDDDFSSSLSEWCDIIFLIDIKWL